MLDFETEEKIPRRLRERLQRKREIQNAAKTIFAQMGYEKATLEEVAALCELSKGSIYYYFESKEALFNSIMTDELEQLNEKISKARELPRLEDSIRKIIKDILTLFARDNEFLKILFREKRELHFMLESAGENTLAAKLNELQNHIAAIFEKGIRNGEIGNFNPRLLVFYLIGFIHTVAFKMEFEPESTSILLADIFLNGIKTKGV